MVDARTRNTTLAAIGGVGWALVPALDGPFSAYWSVVPVAPVLLGFLALELRRRYGGVYGRTGRTGVVFLAVGLGLLTIGSTLYATLAGFPRLFGAVPFAIAGLASVFAAACCLAVSLHRLGVLSRPAAIALPAAGALDVFANALLTPLLGFGVSVFGLAWAGLAVALYRRGPTEHVDTVGESRGFDASATVTALVGAVLLTVAAGRVLPLGPISGSPFVGVNALVDALHALVGGLSLLAAAAADGRVTTWFDRSAGVLLLLVAAAPFAAGTGLAFRSLDLLVVPLSSSILTFSAGLLLAVVGFATSPE